jgi:hypothetical protein
MIRGHLSIFFRSVFAGAVTVFVAACGTSPITAPRIEYAVAPTFANLVHVQLSRVGLPDIRALDIAAIASCRRITPGSNVIGAGEWECTLVWHGPNHRMLRDTYEVSVETNGCYTATLAGTEADLGGPAITVSNGTTMRNVLYAFDGCFDTSGSDPLLAATP